jgi:hypothetical protein
VNWHIAWTDGATSPVALRMISSQSCELLLQTVKISVGLSALVSLEDTTTVEGAIIKAFKSCLMTRLNACLCWLDSRVIPTLLTSFLKGSTSNRRLPPRLMVVDDNQPAHRLLKVGVFLDTIL